MQFFHIRTSKSAPNLTCFVYFHFKMRFSPQRRAIFDFSSATWLRARRFNRPTFRLTRHTHHWKNTAFRGFSNIWRGCIFFLLTFALLHLFSADLTTLLCFSTVHIVGSLLFKFPSIITPSFKAIRKTYSKNLGWVNWFYFSYLALWLGYSIQIPGWFCFSGRNGMNINEWNEMAVIFVRPHWPIFSNIFRPPHGPFFWSDPSQQTGRNE